MKKFKHINIFLYKCLLIFKFKLFNYQKIINTIFYKIIYLLKHWYFIQNLITYINLIIFIINMIFDCHKNK